MKNKEWFYEYLPDADEKENILAYGYKIKKHLYSGKSEFQKIDVIENDLYGRILFLDDIIMTAESDEFIYHEMLAHVPAVSHGNVEDVLIIGGGDGGTARELIRHESIKKIDLIDLDEEVVNVSKEYLPTMGCSFYDERVNFKAEDGVAFVKNSKDKVYDLVLVDSTDSIGPGKVLFSEEFYFHCKRVLKDNGHFVAQALSPMIQPREHQEMNAELKKVFDHLVYYNATIPSYAGGYWLFAHATKTNHNFTAFNNGIAKKIETKTRYYNVGLQLASYRLPNFLYKKIK